MSKKKKQLVSAIDREIEQTLQDMRKEGISDTERLIMSESLGNLARLKMAEVPPTFDEQVKNCLREMEVARLKGDIDTYNKLANSLDSLTKSKANLEKRDGGMGRAFLDGAVTLGGTWMIANSERLHVLSKSVMDMFKFFARR